MSVLRSILISAILLSPWLNGIAEAQTKSATISANDDGVKMVGPTTRVLFDHIGNTANSINAFAGQECFRTDRTLGGYSYGVSRFVVPKNGKAPSLSEFKAVLGIIKLPNTNGIYVGPTIHPSESAYSLIIWKEEPTLSNLRESYSYEKSLVEYQFFAHSGGVAFSPAPFTTTAWDSTHYSPFPRPVPSYIATFNSTEADIIIYRQPGTSIVREMSNPGPEGQPPIPLTPETAYWVALMGNGYAYSDGIPCIARANPSASSAYVSAVPPRTLGFPFTADQAYDAGPGLVAPGAFFRPAWSDAIVTGLNGVNGMTADARFSPVNETSPSFPPGSGSTSDNLFYFPPWAQSGGFYRTCGRGYGGGVCAFRTSIGTIGYAMSLNLNSGNTSIAMND